jgi:hypothetical protein
VDLVYPQDGSGDLDISIDVEVPGLEALPWAFAQMAITEAIEVDLDNGKGELKKFRPYFTTVAARPKDKGQKKRPPPQQEEDQTRGTEVYNVGRDGRTE